jgi:hypothetical protein
MDITFSADAHSRVDVYVIHRTYEPETSDSNSEGSTVVGLVFAGCVGGSCACVWIQLGRAYCDGLHACSDGRCMMSPCVQYLCQLNTERMQLCDYPHVRDNIRKTEGDTGAMSMMVD